MIKCEKTFTGKDETKQLINTVLTNAFKAVCSTMGPDGALGLSLSSNRSRPTKDGVTIAKHLDFDEFRLNKIAEIITEPAVHTDNEVGDGTTTTVFMTYHLMSAVSSKLNFKNIRLIDDLIDIATEVIRKNVKDISHTDPEFRQMLLTTTNYREDIVDTIIDIYNQYEFPRIDYRRGEQYQEDHIVHSSDIHFPGGWGHPRVTQDPNVRIEEGKINIVLIDSILNRIEQDAIEHILNAIKATQKPTAIIARGYTDEAINEIFRINNQIKTMGIIPVSLNAGGSLGSNWFKDLSRLTGTPIHVDSESITSVENFQSINNIILANDGVHFDKNDNDVVSITSDIVKELEVIYKKMSVVQRATPVGKELFGRIGRLKANNVIIYVSGLIPSDTSERYYLYEDAIKAASSALNYGVIPGIGFGFVQVANHFYHIASGYKENEAAIILDLAKLVFAKQYEHLTGNSWNPNTDCEYVDLITGESKTVPDTVFDNGAAAIIALKGAWSVTKTLSKLECIVGGADRSYN